MSACHPLIAYVNFKLKFHLIIVKFDDFVFFVVLSLPFINIFIKLIYKVRKPREANKACVKDFFRYLSLNKGKKRLSSAHNMIIIQDEKQMRKRKGRPEKREKSTHKHTKKCKPYLYQDTKNNFFIINIKYIYTSFSIYA